MAARAIADALMQEFKNFLTAMQPLEGNTRQLAELCVKLAEVASNKIFEVDDIMGKVASSVVQVAERAAVGQASNADVEKHVQAVRELHATLDQLAMRIEQTCTQIRGFIEYLEQEASETAQRTGVLIIQARS